MSITAITDCVDTMSEYQLHEGNALVILPTLEPRSVRTCITSPPYWGLRDYGDSGQDWPAVEFTMALGGAECPVSVPAQTAPLGLEKTPIAYVAHMVAILRKVRRVLTDDGTVWINIGDTYSAHHAQQATGNYGMHTKIQGSWAHKRRGTSPGLKPKDLVGIPWLLAFALRSDGWYLRCDIIWHKRNPMPESVRDRPTRGHEYVFLLAKSTRYHCDMSAVVEPRADDRSGASGAKSMSYAKACRPRDAESFERGTGTLVSGPCTQGRNKRTVWSLSSQPYISPTGRHFAQMPPKLVEPCMLAGSEPGDVVLDPFAGSGSVGQVAIEHGRRFVGIELMSNYCDIARERLERTRERSGLVTADDVQLGQQIGMFG